MERWMALRARLFNAVFAYDSASNGDLIYQCLNELEQLSNHDQKIELEHCQALVQNWSETWYPALTTR